MSKPAEQIREDYEAFDQYVIDLVRSQAEFIRSSDITLEQRFSNLEKGQEQLIIMVKNLEANLKSYREDSKEFMLKTEISNEKFRQEMRQEFDSFRKENDEKFEKIDQRFEKIDQRFEKIDQRFEAINQQFIEVHKAIQRMTVFFISGLGVIVLLSKIVDKVWP